MKKNPRNLRLGFIANYDGSAGGISSQVYILHKKLRAEGADVQIISTKSNIFYKPIILIRTLKKTSVSDILHIHGCSWLGFLPIIIGVIAGRLLQKKIIVTYHGGSAKRFFKKFGFFVFPFLKSADRITVPSIYLKDIFREYDIDAIVIPNIIDIERFEFHERHDVEPKLLIIKHLKSIYNTGMGIKAFAIVKEKFPYAELKIVGSGPQEKELKTLVNELGLSDCVSFLGRIDHRQIAEVYSKSDIFLNCSKVESFGMVLLEAMASGLPIVSTNVGGIPNIIDAGQTGLLVDSGDYNSMAEKILFLLENKDKAFEIAKKGRELSKKYSWVEIRLSLMSTYTGE